MEKFNFKKKYGQNFLIDNNILDAIINSLNMSTQDLLIEIGAGSGNLTSKLKKFNAQLLAYEIDLETARYLDKLSDDKTIIVYEDFLKSDIKTRISNMKYNDLYIVGNLPYYITTAIIEKIIKEKIKPKEMIFMVQKEVAERLTAKPGRKAYGYITAYLNYWYEVEKLFDVSPQCFNPAPNVESSVIKLTRHAVYSCDKEEKLVVLLSDAFKYKRKTLLNNLKSYDKSLIIQILNKHKLSLTIRAEAIPLEVFIEIANAL